MYRSTTGAQLLKSASIWAIWVGGFAFFMTVASLWSGYQPWQVIPVTLFWAAGWAGRWYSTRKLREIDAQNLPLLFSPEGQAAIRKRREFKSTLQWSKWVLLLLFLVLGLVYLVLLSALICDTSTEGMCGRLDRYDQSTIDLWRNLTFAMGAAYVFAVTFARVHEDETDRQDETVNRGQRYRDFDNPLASLQQRTWE